MSYQVEDCLFKVPREPLEAESTVFRDMFLLPQGDKAKVEGLSDANPVVLGGVKKKDFEQLLKALMCRSAIIFSSMRIFTDHGRRKYGKNVNRPILEQGQWISVLKLSTMWEFGGLRRSAIDNLDGGSNPLNPVDKFLLALRYDVTEWTLSALLKLAQRPEPISIEEGRKLGLETALKIASVREKFRLRPQALCDYCENRAKNGKYLTVGNRDPETEKLDFTRKIRAAFDL